MMILSSIISFHCFFSGFTESPFSKLYTQSSGLVACRCNATVRGSAAGYPSSQDVGGNLNGHLLSPSMYRCFFQNIPYTSFHFINNCGTPQVPIAGVTLGSSSEKLPATAEVRVSTSSNSEDPCQVVQNYTHATANQG